VKLNPGTSYLSCYRQFFKWLENREGISAPRLPEIDFSTKEKKPILFPMLQEDIDLYESLPRGLPDMYFFRHHKGPGVKNPGGQIDRKAFWRWWKKACRNLGIEGIDLYGGTRHSSASSLAEYATKDEIRDNATMHGTNKAFERYFQHEAAPSRFLYPKLAKKAQGKGSKLVRLEDKRNEKE
jgi:integrase